MPLGRVASVVLAALTCLGVAGDAAAEPLAPEVGACVDKHPGDDCTVPGWPAPGRCGYTLSSRIVTCVADEPASPPPAATSSASPVPKAPPPVPKAPPPVPTEPAPTSPRAPAIKAAPAPSEADAVAETPSADAARGEGAREPRASLTVRDEGAQRPWYGWQILITDVAAAGFVLAGSSDRHTEGTLYTLAGFTYVLGGPIVHWSHGYAGRGWGSFGMRIGLPIGGALMGLVADSRNGDTAVGGLVLGYLAAVVLDVVVLGFEKDEAPKRPVSGPVVAPTASLTQHGGMLGVQGMF
jgi:hypothetical protein